VIRAKKHKLKEFRAIQSNPICSRLFNAKIRDAKIKKELAEVDPLIKQLDSGSYKNKTGIKSIYSRVQNSDK